jgi:prophage antirepressor-like protein
LRTVQALYLVEKSMLEMHNSLLTIPERLNPTGIRIRVAGTRADPLWCMADWCQLLGYKDVAHAVNQWVERLGDEALACVIPHKKKWRGPLEYHEKWYMRESELFELILGCELESAAPLQEWLDVEVYPSLEEYGYYPPPSVQEADYQRWLDWLDAAFLQHDAAVGQHKAGGFSVLTAIKTPLLAVAEELFRQELPVKLDDRPDMQVEQGWERHRKGKGFPKVTTFAPLDLPEPGGTVVVKVYGPEELAEFNEWFSREYLPAAFPSLFPDEVRRSKRTHRRY